MNLKRGLLRLWVVLALIWVTATTSLLWDEVTVGKPKFLIASSLNGHYSIEGPEGATKEQALDHFYKALMKVEAGPDPGSISVQSPDEVIHEFPSSTSIVVIKRTLKQHWQSKLAEFRQKYPEYNGMSDETLADALYKRFYSDMPREQFNTKIGLNDNQVAITEEVVANWPRRRTALALIVLPPLALLIVGAGLFWAAQGFVRRPV